MLRGWFCCNCKCMNILSDEDAYRLGWINITALNSVTNAMQPYDYCPKCKEIGACQHWVRQNFEERMRSLWKS